MNPFCLLCSPAPFFQITLPNSRWFPSKRSVPASTHGLLSLLLSQHSFFPCHACRLSVFSCVPIFVTLQTLACQAPLFLWFSRHEYWSGLPCPLLGDLPDPGIESATLMSPKLAVRAFTSRATWEAPFFLFSSVQFTSVAQSCPTLCDPMDCSRPVLPVHHQLPEFTQTCPSSRWCLPTISSFVIPFSSCPQSFPASGSFQMSQFFASGGQSIRASASVLPMNIQDWSPLGWTGWISLQSKGLSNVFFNTAVQKHRFFGAQLALWSNPHIQHDYWKNHSFDYMDLRWQSTISAF